MRKFRVWAEIDLDQLIENLKIIRSIVGDGVKIMAVVKANAYGHGAKSISQYLLRHGTDMLGVGDSSEALELRTFLLKEPIVILGAIIEEEVKKIVYHNIYPTFHSYEMAELVNSEAKEQNRILNVFIKVDTGMGRLGISPENCVDLAKRISRLSNLKILGLTTHFSSAVDEDLSFTREQMSKFTEVASNIEESGIKLELKSAANTPALVKIPESHFDMVRPGIGLYGLNPANYQNLGIGTKPILSLKTQIAYLKRVKANYPIGYNRTYYTKSETTIATLPVGYNDGYPHSFSNRAEMIVRGKRVPVVGSVTMDYTMIDVGHIEGVRVGDEVTIIGKDGDEEITVDELAKLKDSIPYDITSSLGTRVVRFPIAKKYKQRNDEI